MTDLELVDSESLISELLNRFDSAIFAAQSKVTQKRACIIRRAKGDPLICAGMASIMAGKCGETIDCSDSDSDSDADEPEGRWQDGRGSRNL